MPLLRPTRFAALALLLVPAVAGAAPTHHPNHSNHSSHSKPKGAPVLKSVSHRRPTAKVEPPAVRHIPAKSVGSPTEGHLVNGVRLQDAPYLRIVPVYAAGDVRWGLESLVGLIDRAAKNVRKQYPDAVLSVGHLSRPGGGELDRHASHESGRDADIGFYIKSQQNKPLYADHFVPFKADGTAASWPGAHFDDARNWALIAAIAGDGQTHVTHIFVTTSLRQRLLDYAARIGSPQNLRNRAAELMAQPKGALPHDDHFHVRVGCPHGMDQCVEQPVAHHKPQKPQAPAQARASDAPKRPTPPHPSHAPAKPSSKSEHDDDDAESAKSDSIVPSLAPAVPGLGSVVIPAPLATPKSDKPAPVPQPPVIDDPDGVLEQR